MISTSVREDIYSKRGEGHDLNSILLIQKENQQLSKRAKMVRRYMVTLMLQMQRAANLALQMVKLMLDELKANKHDAMGRKAGNRIKKDELLRDPTIKKFYAQEVWLRNEYENAKTQLAEYVKEMQVQTGKAQDFINMTKVNYLIHMFDMYIDKLQILYDAKNSKIYSSRSAFQIGLSKLANKARERRKRREQEMLKAQQEAQNEHTEMDMKDMTEIIDKRHLVFKKTLCQR